MPGEDKPTVAAPDRESLIREELRRVLVSNAFRASRRAAEFLELIVEHALAGRFDSLRERMLGAEMFGRPVDYDAANDAVVRVKATEVRRRLTMYYDGLPTPSPLRIALPPGSYVPQFIEDEAEPGIAPGGVVEQPHPSRQVDPSGAARPPSPARINWRRFAMAASALILAAAPVLWYLRKPALAPATVRSIAVLPLANFSSDPHQQYFAQSMTQELTAELAQVSSLRVIARTSAMTYEGTKKTIPQIAGELHVDAVVEGSVELAGERVRITTELVDARSDETLWARSYDRTMTDMLKLQSELALAICSQIRAQLTPQEQQHFHLARPVDAQAVRLYLQGMHELNEGKPELALADLRPAVEDDPGYAAAHSALATAYGWMGESGKMPYDEAFSLQRTEALRAIELDDSSPDPHLDLASALLNQNWDWEGARRELQKALILGQNSTDVHWAWASFLMRTGNLDEAVAEANAAVQLDPVSSRAYSNRAWIEYFARRYDAALEDLHQAARLPHTPIELNFLYGDIYAEQGHYDEAAEEFRPLGNAPHAMGHLWNAEARQGHSADALVLAAALEKEVAKTGIGCYEIALIYAGLHDRARAFHWLEQALQVRDKGMLYLRIDPCLDPLRSDPRLGELMRRVGFSA